MPPPDTHIDDLPTGWARIARFDGPSVTILEFGRDGKLGARVTAIGVTFEQAPAYGRDQMLFSDERNRQHGVL